MRNALLSVVVLAGLTACASGSAYADAPCADPPSAPCSPPRPAVQRRPPAAQSPRIEVVDEGNSPLPTFGQNGRTYVLGAVGTRYLVRVVNPTPARVEAVISVDGIDAVDGRPASTTKRGYIVPAWGNVTIDGWRTSMDSVAAFRFSSVRDSYAGRTGHDRNVGVIGVAFFRERPRPVWRPQANIAKGAPSPAPSPASPPAARSSADMGSGAGGAGGASTQSAPKAEAAERPGLGTEFGEAHSSSVEEVTFARAESTPMTVAQLWYDDRDGLVARGISVPPRDAREAEIELRESAQPFAERFAQPPP
jgi:hypothetical protein